MKIITIFLTFFIISSTSYSQDLEINEDEIVLYNPITWGTMVYVKASDTTKKNLLERLAAYEGGKDYICNKKYDDFENWYCEKTPELVFSKP